MYEKLIQNLFSLALIGLFSSNVNAEQISHSDATSIATDFLSKSNSISTQSSKKLKLAYTAKAVSNPDKNCFFVFNRGLQEGFIIVAADDCSQTSVLGYRNNGEFDSDNMPSNFKWWIEQYQREIDYAIKNNLQSSPTISTYSTSVSPLLGNIAWNQGDPYNLLCPTLTNSSGNIERTVTGCVATATATAQMMCYYKWPTTGTGSNSYTWESGGTTLSMDFSQSTYDWENMTETYNNSSTDAEKNAVAKLMYDCGISCNMDYGLSETGGSGASSLKQAYGLYNYFGYDKGMRHVNLTITS